jgi:hypothetical protein
MRPVFFKLTLWNDPQKGAKRPAEWGACRAANRSVLPSERASLIRLVYSCNACPSETGDTNIRMVLRRSVGLSLLSQLKRV